MLRTTGRRGQHRTARVAGGTIAAIAGLIALSGTGCDRPGDTTRAPSRRMEETRALARDLEERGDLSGAHVAFREASRRHPTEAWPWAGLGRTSEALGRFRDAEDAYQTAVRWDSTRADAYAGLARLARDADRGEEALQWLDAADRLRGPTPGGAALRARVLSALGRHGEARSTLDRAITASPRHAGLRAASVRCRLAAGEQAQAIAELDVATGMDEHHPDVASARAELLSTFGDTDGAIESLRRALTSGASRPRVRRELAAMLLADRRIEAAAEEYRALLEADPRNAFALEGLGRCARATGDESSAEVAFRRALDVDPDYAPAHLALGLLLVDAGRADEAVTLLRKARTRAIDGALWEECSLALGDTYLELGEAAHALEIADAALVRRPESTRARTLRAQALAAGGGGGGSGAELERLAARADALRGEILSFTRWLLEHGLPARADTILAEYRAAHPEDTDAAFLHARTLAATARTEAAETVLHDLLTDQPSAANVRLELAQLYLDEGRTNDAVFHAGEGERLLPDHADFPALRGRAALADGRLDDARTAFQRARDLDPGNSARWVELGRLELRAGDPGRASGHFARAADLAPDDWTPVYLKALAQEAAGQRELAIEGYRAVLARDDRVAAAHNNLAWLLADGELDPVLAEVHARRAAELAPDNADVLGTLGWAQYRNGRLDEAARSLERAVEAAPEDPMKRYLLGVVQFEAGHLDRARSSLLAALERPESFARADRARELLDRLDRPDR